MKTRIFLLLLLVLAHTTEAKTVKLRKVQEVNFSEMSLNGTIRNPDGAYLVQKKGLKFKPLHKVMESFDQKLRESLLYAE